MYTFSKSERLCNKKLTEELFLNGNSFTEDPFRIIYLEIKSEENILKTQITVPKRNVAKAVDRNFIKRQIRESFRKNKGLLIEFIKKENISLHCAIIFQKSSIIQTKALEKKIKILFHRLINKL